MMWKLPRLQVEWIETRPIKGMAAAGHQILFFAGDKRRQEYAERCLQFCRARTAVLSARRRSRHRRLIKEARTTGKQSFQGAMRLGLQRVLCAPGFLFLGEPSGKSAKSRPLTDHELATRLSYFLWSTMPDDELILLAGAGTLREPKTLAAQVSRMLADSKADLFVKNFAGQWLSVREFGSIQPAADYKNWDKALEQASKEEPYAFFAEVLNKNLPITSLLDSDFLVINERLAKHYGMTASRPGVSPRPIKPEYHRGGVLGWQD